MFGKKFLKKHGKRLAMALCASVLVGIHAPSAFAEAITADSIINNGTYIGKDQFILRGSDGVDKVIIYNSSGDINTAGNIIAESLQTANGITNNGTYTGTGEFKLQNSTGEDKVTMNNSSGNIWTAGTITAEGLLTANGGITSNRIVNEGSFLNNGDFFVNNSSNTNEKVRLGISSNYFRASHSQELENDFSLDNYIYIDEFGIRNGTEINKDGEDIALYARQNINLDGIQNIYAKFDNEGEATFFSSIVQDEEHTLISIASNVDGKNLNSSIETKVDAIISTVGAIQPKTADSNDDGATTPVNQMSQTTDGVIFENTAFNTGFGTDGKGATSTTIAGNVITTGHLITDKLTITGSGNAADAEELDEDELGSIVLAGDGSIKSNIIDGDKETTFATTADGTYTIVTDGDKSIVANITADGSSTVVGNEEAGNYSKSEQQQDLIYNTVRNEVDKDNNSLSGINQGADSVTTGVMTTKDGENLMSTIKQTADTIVSTVGMNPSGEEGPATNVMTQSSAGVVFENSDNNTAFGTGGNGATSTTISGNVITTGHLITDKLTITGSGNAAGEELVDGALGTITLAGDGSITSNIIVGDKETTFATTEDGTSTIVTEGEKSNTITSLATGTTSTVTDGDKSNEIESLATGTTATVTDGDKEATVQAQADNFGVKVSDGDKETTVQAQADAFGVNVKDGDKETTVQAEADIFGVNVKDGDKETTVQAEADIFGVEVTDGDKETTVQAEVDGFGVNVKDGDKEVTVENLADSITSTITDGTNTNVVESLATGTTSTITDGENSNTTIANATSIKNTIGGFTTTTTKDGVEYSAGVENNKVNISSNDVSITYTKDNEVHDVKLSDLGQIKNLDSQLLQRPEFTTGSEANTAVGAINAEAQIRREEDYKINARMDRVGALAAAAASLKSICYDPNNPTEFAMGVGTYRGDKAVSVGVFHYPNKNFLLNLSYTQSGSEKMGGFGATWRFGNKKNTTNEIKPVDVKALTSELDTTKAELAELKSQSQTEIAELKEQIKLLMAKVQK